MVRQEIERRKRQQNNNVTSQHPLQCSAGPKKLRRKVGEKVTSSSSSSSSVAIGHVASATVASKKGWVTGERGTMHTFCFLLHGQVKVSSGWVGIKGGKGELEKRGECRMITLIVLLLYEKNNHLRMCWGEKKKS